MKNVIVLIIACAIGLISVFSSESVSACEMMESKFIVMSCVALNDCELMDKETGIIYGGFSDLKQYELYRCPCFVAERPEDNNIIDIDLWVDYLKYINSYNHDLTRVEICKCINNNMVISSEGEIYTMYDSFMNIDNYYYVFFDIMNTDNYIYDDIIIEILDCSVFDIELFECSQIN